MLSACNFALCAVSSATACFCSCRERFVFREDKHAESIEQQFRNGKGQCTSQCSVDIETGNLQRFHP